MRCKINDAPHHFTKKSPKNQYQIKIIVPTQYDVRYINVPTQYDVYYLDVQHNTMLQCSVSSFSPSPFSSFKFFSRNNVEKFKTSRD